MKFSDGEKLTAAILLYCVLVRLRARQKVRTDHLLTKDSGMLLLDNPFGKATLAEFVDLQPADGTAHGRSAHLRHRHQ